MVFAINIRQYKGFSFCNNLLRKNTELCVSDFDIRGCALYIHHLSGMFTYPTFLSWDSGFLITDTRAATEC